MIKIGIMDKKTSRTQNGGKAQNHPRKLGWGLSAAQASALLGLPERQIKRLRKGAQEKGIGAHGNTGKPASARIKEERREHTVGLYREKHYGSSFQHFTELLEGHGQIAMSGSTAKSALNAEGIKSPKTKRKPKRHIRRKRHEHGGPLVQAGAAPHGFFAAGDDVCLRGIIGDAAGKALGLYMAKNECLGGRLSVFGQMVGFGIPGSAYAGRRTRPMSLP